MLTKNKRTVAILGWYNHNNFGDDIAILGGLRNLFSGWNINIYSDKTILDFDAINKCDLFVLGGGELINSDRLFFGSKWINNIKIPKVVLGCGVNVENDGQLKNHVIKDLEAFSYIGLRDNTSVSILKSFPNITGKIDLFYDCAFSLDTDKFVWFGSKDLAMVFPTDRQTDKYDKGIRVFNVALNSQGWLRQQLEPFGSSVFVPFGGDDNNDYSTCQRLFSLGNNGEIVQPTLPELLRLLSTCKLAIAYRLHSLILSFIIGVPYVFYPYHWKLKRVHDTLECCDPNKIKLKQKRVKEEIENKL